MKQHLSFQNIVIVLLLLTQVYWMYKINQPSEYDTKLMEATEEIVDQNESILSDNAELRSILREERSLYNDTVTMIKQQRTINYNNYVQSINRVFNADSGAQFSMYRDNSRRFDSAFYSGQFNSE